MMRRILVDFARSRQSLKRGGQALRVPLEEHVAASQDTGVDLLDLDEALNQLAAFDPRKARVVREEQQKRERGEYSALQALFSGRVWRLAVIYFGMMVGTYTLNFWVPQLVKSLSTRYSNTVGGLVLMIPNLAGLKFTNPDLMAFQLCLRAGDGSFDVPWGCDEFLLAAVALGATGAVGSTYNFAGPIYHRVLSSFAKGDLASARQDQFRAVQVIQILVRYGFIASTKAVMGMLGVDVGPARLPHPQLSREQTAALQAELESLGFFDWI